MFASKYKLFNYRYTYVHVIILILMIYLDFVIKLNN